MSYLETKSKRRIPLRQGRGKALGGEAIAAAAQETFELAAGSEAAIDLVHLERMTLGEKSLAHEVLRLFDSQASALLAHIVRANAETAGALAHTLKGSARGIGAWQVARTAEQFEIAARDLDRDEIARCLEDLRRAVAQARDAIAAMLAAA